MIEIPKTLEPAEGALAAAAPSPENMSFTAFYAEASDELINGLKKRFGAGPPEPEDVAQEAFRRIFEHPRFAHVKNKRAFLWRTAMNLASSELRKINVRERRKSDIRDVFFSEEGDISTPESVLSIREQLDAIRKLVADMPERRRRVFMMRRVEGLKKAQIARMLGISHSGVVKHLQKADQQLSELLLKDEG